MLSMHKNVFKILTRYYSSACINVVVIWHEYKNIDNNSSL